MYKHVSMRALLHFTIAVVLAAGAGISALAQAPEVAAASGSAPAPYDLKENYTKYEYRIPMRDGMKLFTVAYIPRTAAGSSHS